MDDPFVSCPFDKKHRVPRSRIQAHIVKCQEKHPGFEACPYNATHRMSKSKLKEHVVNCPSRDAIFPEDVPPKVIADIKIPTSYLHRPYLPENDPDHELWDDERA